MLTANEKQVLRFLATSIGKDFSINDIAKKCNLAPNGAYKILKKLEKEGVIKAKIIANIKSYKLNFEHIKTIRIGELALMPDNLEGRIRLRANDLKALKEMTEACILFGSYITAKQKPGDLDVLFILKKKNFRAYKQILAKVQDIVPLKIQDVVQTADDVIQNLKKNDLIVMEAIRNGIVLWGFEVLMQVIRDASE